MDEETIIQELPEQAEEQQEKTSFGIKKRQKAKATGNTAKKPKNPWFKRGKNVLCLLVTPGSNNPVLVKLRKTEAMIIDRDEDRKFAVSTGPILKIDNKNSSIDCYVIDEEKGCTVDLTFVRDKGLMEMGTDPEQTYDIIDSHFVSQLSNLKPDWKQSVGMALFFGFLSFMFGLMF